MAALGIRRFWKRKKRAVRDLAKVKRILCEELALRPWASAELQERREYSK